MPKYFQVNDENIYIYILYIYIYIYLYIYNKLQKFIKFSVPENFVPFVYLDHFCLTQFCFDESL